MFILKKGSMVCSNKQRYELMPTLYFYKAQCANGSQ